MGSVDLHTALGYDVEEDVAAGLRLDLEDAADWAEFAVAVAELEPGPWRRQAACKGNGRQMFPERGESAAPAKAMCASCPVFVECREWADENEVKPIHGFIAGESARERVSRRAAQRREVRESRTAA